MPGHLQSLCRAQRSHVWYHHSWQCQCAR
jgi:hypothetical protein